MYQDGESEALSTSVYYTECKPKIRRGRELGMRLLLSSGDQVFTRLLSVEIEHT